MAFQKRQTIISLGLPTPHEQSNFNLMASLWQRKKIVIKMDIDYKAIDLAGPRKGAT